MSGFKVWAFFRRIGRGRARARCMGGRAVFVEILESLNEKGDKALLPYPLYFMVELGGIEPPTS